MKKFICPLIVLALVLTMTGCSLFPQATVKKSAAQKQCEAYLEDIQYGEGLAQDILKTGSEKGIMHEVLEGIEYKILSTQDQEDGSVLCRAEIISLDMIALLKSLPEDIDSEETARKAMLNLAREAARKTYEAELTLIPVEGSDEYTIQPSGEFLNAITGGMYDLLRTAFESEELQ